ncbi:DUF6602 domain-containing protein [Paenibacillus wenxiniae]|uniref:DUF6602 domain-containing protein n=1 Tax=Paenibacillus wenxiniae TaxID=1636843 RepID=A0ABW4RN70_9BACL
MANSSNEDKKVFEQIEKNYRYLNKTMVEEINIAAVHGGLTGDYREEMWIKFFRSIIPLKYSIAQGVLIIDSEKRVSREVDIAIYDDQYTPYVFQYNTLKFIPIEAVVVAIECKSTDVDEEALITWADSIARLEPKASGIARTLSGYSVGFTNPTQKKSRPIRILATNLTKVKDTTIQTHITKLQGRFDFVILKQPKEDMLFEVVVPNEKKKLGWWGDTLNGLPLQQEGEEILKLHPTNPALFEGMTESHPELKFDKDKVALDNTLADLRIPNNPLLTLNFQLNQLLMLINNPMLFPHFAYAKAFQEVASPTTSLN